MRQRGFSLLEAVITLGLSALVLSVSGRIMAEYGRLNRVAQAQSEMVEASQSALRWLVRRLHAAHRWNSPARDQRTATSVLEWEEHIYPRNIDRISGPLPSPKARQGRVAIEGEGLVCTLTDDTGERRVVLGTSVSALACIRREPNWLEIRLTVATPHGAKILNAMALLQVGLK